MSLVAQVELLQQQGRFLEALSRLESGAAPRDERLAVELLRAEIYERLGRYSESRIIAERLVTRSDLSPNQKARAECTIGLIDMDEGHSEVAATHFQRSIAIAKAAKNLQLSCLSQLRLLVLLADRSGHEVIAPLLSQVRADVIKLGSPTVSATLHILMGAIEARRGLLLNGVRHTRLGLQILEGTENLWLEALGENTLVAAAIMQSDITGGIEFAEKALRKAEQSGAAVMRRAILANLGNLFYRLGEFETAIRYFEEARNILATSGERHNGALDSIALVCWTKDVRLKHGRALRRSIRL